MGLVQGKTFLVTGVLTNASIAFHVARLLQEEGGNLILTGFGRGLSITTRIAGRLPYPAPVLELDVTDDEHLARLAELLGEHVGQDGLAGVLHSIGFAPQGAMGGNFLHTTWPDVATAMQVSTFSYKSLAMACLPLMHPAGRRTHLA